MGKGDLAYDRVLICIRGAKAEVWDGKNFTPVLVAQQIKDATSYKLKTIPCRLLITTLEGNRFDVMVLSEEKTGINIEYSKIDEKPEEQTANKPEPRKSVAMLDVLKGIYMAVYNAVEQNDAATAVAAMDLLMPQLDEFEANLKGTEAQEPVALVIKQVRLIYKALKQGDLNQAKVLLKSLDAVGQQIENKIREAGNNRAAM